MHFEYIYNQIFSGTNINLFRKGFINSDKIRDVENFYFIVAFLKIQETKTLK